MALKIWLTVLTLASLSACVEPNGSIASGEKFGIQVGMPLEGASTVLRQRGFESVLPITNKELPGCGGRLRGRDEEISAFDNPRGPLVCLFVVSGRVAALAWEYTLP